MLTAMLIMAVLLPMMMAGMFLLARHLYRRPYASDDLSAVSRQHIELFQGGQINEGLVEAAKNRIRDMLERGEVRAVEAGLRPGLHYAGPVPALAEVRTETAGR